MEFTDRQRKILAVVAGLVFLVLAGLGSQHFDQLIPWLEWIRTAGPKGWAVFAAIYVLCTVLMLPASILEGATGFLLGPILGAAVASFSATFSATLSYLLAKTVLRDFVAKRVEQDPRFRAIDATIEEGGTYLVVLLRLSPLAPFNVINYMLGLTRVRMRQFVLGTWVGSLPAVILYTWIGSTVHNLTDLVGEGAHSNPTAQLVGLATTIVASVLVARFAQTALKTALASVE